MNSIKNLNKYLFNQYKLIPNFEGLSELEDMPEINNSLEKPWQEGLGVKFISHKNKLYQITIIDKEIIPKYKVTIGINMNEITVNILKSLKLMAIPYTNIKNKNIEYILTEYL